MNQDLRLATLDDLQAVENVVRAAYSHYVARIGRKPGPMLDDYNALTEGGRVHVIEHGGAVQGVLVLIPEESAMLLENVAVSPDKQGLGLGRQLLEFAERAAIGSGYGSIKLYTHEAITENIGLYSRTGYVETHRAEEKDCGGYIWPSRCRRLISRPRRFRRQMSAFQHKPTYELGTKRQILSLGH